MNYDRIVAELQQMKQQLSRIENKLDRALWEDGGPAPSNQRQNNVNKKYTDEEIIQHGTRVAYNLMNNPQDVVEFKNFIYDVQRSLNYSQKEKDYARFADKAFDDVRLSENHVRILSAAYQRVHGKPWPWRLQKGYMFNLDNEIAWEWQ